MVTQSIIQAVVETLQELGVDCRPDRSARHPRVLWEDPQSGQRGIITVPGSPSDHRSLVNNVTMARRIIRAARSR